MRPMQHSYTNHTVGDATRVEKTYVGPDAADRLACERAALLALRRLMPVPAVDEVHEVADVNSADEVDATVSAAPEASGVLTVRLERLPGTHGQELIEQGHAARVLHACGRVLRQLHKVPTTGRFGTALGQPAEAGQVLIHGDFGPNNTLLDPTTFAVTALLDWEFAHFGSPIEDLAWCEWIIRTHHAAHIDALAEFYAGYGRAAPAWADRQAAMLERCWQLEQFCRRWQGDGGAVQLWRDRAAATAGWRE